MVDANHPPVRVKVVEAAGADYAVLQIEAPAGTALPPHVCSREDSTLIVLAGAVEVVVASGCRLLGPGDSVRLPRSTPRRGHVVADARLLCVVMPGGLERLADLVFSPIADRDDLAAILAAAGVGLLPRGWGERRGVATRL